VHEGVLGQRILIGAVEGGVGGGRLVRRRFAQLYGEGPSPYSRPMWVPGWHSHCRWVPVWHSDCRWGPLRAQQGAPGQPCSRVLLCLCLCLCLGLCLCL